MDQPDQNHIANETERLAPLIDTALAALPAREREVIILHHLDNQSHAAIALHYDVAEGTVASWLSRGRERLRRALAKQGCALSSAALATAITALPATAGSADLTTACVAIAVGKTAPSAAVTRISAAGSGMSLMTRLALRPAAIVAASLVISAAGIAVVVPLVVQRAGAPALTGVPSMAPSMANSVRATTTAATEAADIPMGAPGRIGIWNHDGFTLGNLEFYFQFHQVTDRVVMSEALSKRTLAPVLFMTNFLNPEDALSWVCELSGTHWSKHDGVFTISDGPGLMTSAAPSENWRQFMRSIMSRKIQPITFSDRDIHCTYNDDKSQACFANLDQALSIIRIGGTKTGTSSSATGPNIILDPQLVADQTPMWIPTTPMTCQEMLDYLTAKTGTQTELRHGAIYVTKRAVESLQTSN